MSINKHSEVEVLKEELNFLTDLLQGHKTHGAYYQRPQFSGVPYVHPSAYNRKTSVQSTKLNSLSTYKSYHANRTNIKNSFDDRTGQIFTSRSFVYKPVPVPVFPKQTSGYSAKQDALWKRNQVLGSTQNLSSSSFKIVRTSASAKVTSTDSEIRAIANNIKAVAGTSISAVDNTHSCSEVNTSSVRNAKVSNLKPTSECASSKKDNLQPLEKNVATKRPKAAKVSYVPCSDCIIEISEYENGELEITQKKLDPSVQDSEEKAFIGNPSASAKTLKSSLCETVVEKDLTNNRHQKVTTGSDSSKATLGNAAETDFKLSNISSQRKPVSSPSKFKSQHLCARNAKYSKVNVSTSKPQNSVAKHILKNKYSVKKSNIVKCKISKELKGCTPHPLKYVRVSKSASQKCLVNYSPKRTALLPVRNINKRTSYTSYSNLNSFRQSQARNKITKSSFPPLSFAKVSKKAKAVQSVYKVVNKPNSVVSKTPKGSHLCKTLSESNSSNLGLKNGDPSSDKKWFKSDNGAISVGHCSFSSGAQQNSPNTVAKSETKKILHSSLSHKTSSCEFKNVLNASKIVSRHSLQRVVQKKSFIKKPSLNPSRKSFSDSYTHIKKTKKVRLSKTTYKVVNRYANHVSQVVQMIKTKYRTVNKRSASNSHLKWLQEQRRAYLSRKCGKSLHSHAKTGWAYHCHPSGEHLTRKHLLHSKTPRKHSLKQNRVLKNICGITYKVSKTQLKKSFTPKRTKKSHFTLGARKNSAVINVHGTKFQMSPGGKSLKRLGTTKEGNKTAMRRIKFGGFTYVQQKEDSACLVKFSSRTQNVASRMLHRSINTVRAAEAKKTLQKSNIFCMFFNRFGRCNKEGNCPYIHDPSKIAVCTRFLRGTCKNNGCPFSHEISPGKMAICSFFLQGNCTNNNCPYRHTSLKPGTRLCKAFVKGYCNKGSECQDAHLLACPQFICEGFCEKESCMWPHPPVKNNIKKRSDPPEVSKEIKEKDVATDDICDQRYFTYEPGLVSDKCIKLRESVTESAHTNEKVPKVRNKKIAFPKQPEFIPLIVSDEEL